MLEKITESVFAMIIVGYILLSVHLAILIKNRDRVAAITLSILLILSIPFTPIIQNVLVEKVKEVYVNTYPELKDERQKPETFVGIIKKCLE